ncbi:hypothetical protein MGG_03377 [Pyricularia oryzae 70-15]|uniref:ELYS-like domain-containing protein n=3 Tax=Pyricularia oryzae TaxID=318829 RepID=G4N8V5_PYRO7|nr:uncharacterized protein MGG_03377 [Pyricularia oryzae 70-15]EHA50249.1 hypothetical protein MGG_03377 [Pyricularia oryzae 70-15]ELQ35081.1 hypothetical protein OOU_Y34scaffold00726g41 [Pyricularia oryzae Y34]KAI7921746.1 hypothetical protein M0657_005938 [Pyricularia oryzae]KAI7928759.1 hypothetical protein M9X92_001553 [Pyricularia oryzae]
MTSIDFTHYEQVFQPDLESPYAPDLVREIESYRKGFGGVLFVDKVLSALGVTKAKSYPPRGDNALRELHQKVCQSKSAAQQKLSVLYYLLLDFDDILGVRSRLAEEFAEKSGVPGKYQIFMKGLWHMDRQQFPVALEYLAHPSLVPEFADDIITILVRHARDDDFSWALAYYQTVNPVLKTPEALELYFIALARTSVTEALLYSRTHPESARRLFFEQLVASVHDGPSSAGLAGPGSREQRARTLASLPLDRDEERWLDEYLTGPEGRRLKNGRDTWVMRKIATNRMSELGDDNLRAHLAAFGRPSAF